MNVHVPIHVESIVSPHPKQAILIACPVYEIFFGGARGGGKTFSCILKCIRHAFDYGKRANILFVRKTLVSLQEAIQVAHSILPMLGASWNEQKKTYTFPDAARLKFAYLENEKDAQSYQGHSYTLIIIDEAGQYETPNAINMLRATLGRVQGVNCQLIMTGNPGGPGQHWIKERFIDPAPQGLKVLLEKFKDPSSANILRRERVYIPSRVDDNPSLGIEYKANLSQSGSAALVKAWLDGDWNAIEGAYFDEWNHDKHVVRPFRIPPEWKRFRCMDWGTAHPSAVYWAAEVPDDYLHMGKWLLPRGCLVVYREFYTCVQGKPNTGTKITVDELADRVLDLSQGETINIGWADPSIFQFHGSETHAQRMAAKGLYWQSANNTRTDPARKARSEAVIGWDAVRQRLRGDADGHPLIVFFETCPHVIRTLPVLQHSEINPEDLDTKAEDHAADAIRYLCNGRPYAKMSQLKSEVTFSGARQHIR